MSALRKSLQAVFPAGLPHVWKAQEMARAQEGVVASGHAALDAELPGGGWPLGLVEVVQDRPEQHVWQLTGPALVHCLQTQPGPLVLVAAPFAPFLASLQAQGLAGSRMLWVKAGKPAQRLWAAEQALRCAEVAAVLAWLPQATSAELRRLQMAAQQHSKLLFVFRTPSCVQEASAARVRVQLGGTQEIALRILKRRGPPLTQPLLLPACPPRLEALLAARKRRPSTLPAAAVQSTHRSAFGARRSDVLDRIAAPG